MRTMRIFLSLMFFVLSTQIVYAESNDAFTSEERQFLDELKKRGASEEQIKQLEHMMKMKRRGDKQWSEKDLKDLDMLLTSKWEGMRKALESGDVDTAVSFICKKNRDKYRHVFSKQPREQLIQISKDLADIKMIKMQGSHWAEYDLRKERDGKTYSYPLIFEKNSDDVWEIRSF